MSKTTASSAATKDPHGFPVRTSWTQLANLRSKDTQSIQGFCEEFYLVPLQQYATSAASELQSALDLEDCVMEFVESKLPNIIRSATTRQPTDRMPLFRHLVRRRFQQFLLDKQRAASRQKRGGHLRQVELTRESDGSDSLELEPIDITTSAADIQFDLECLRQHYLRAKHMARQEYARRRRVAEFDVLIEALENHESFSATVVAKRLPGKSAGAIRTAKSRLEDELGDFLKKSVGEAERISLPQAEGVLRDLFDISKLKGTAPTTPTTLAPS
ncbi:MAG: ECF-type sigma factor [Verrucomicrobiota bacterium]